jgi:hypothetical protein
MYATIQRFRRRPDEDSHQWGRTLLPDPIDVHRPLVADLHVYALTEAPA